VSEDPDIFFEVDENGRIAYAQIAVDGEEIEIDIFMGAASGTNVDFVIASTGETQGRMLFRSSANFNRNRLVVTRRDNSGLLDASVTEIIFIREEMDDPRYVIGGYPTEGIWVSEELGITVDFNEAMRFYPNRFRGTLVVDDEIRNIVCGTNSNGNASFFFTDSHGGLYDSPIHRGFFRFRSGEDDVFVFVSSRVRYTFVRQEE